MIKPLQQGEINPFAVGRRQGRDDGSAVNALSLLRKNTSESRVVPSGNRIRYASPDLDDFEAHNLMKSSTVFTRSPAAVSLSRKWSAAFLASYSAPFLMNATPFKVSTDPIRYLIFTVSLES